MEWNTELTKIHHTNYVRNSRAITVAWFIFSACYTILNVVAFLQPFWFGDTVESPGVGYFGLYEWCERAQGSDYTCRGDFLDFNTIQNNYFRAASFLVGGAALLFIITIILMGLFLFLKARIVLRICGTLQMIAAVFMAVGCIIYPNSFDDENVRRICGQSAKPYMMDKCQIRWAYILAIVLIFDALILAILAFVIAARQARSLSNEFQKLKEDESHINNGFSGTLTRSNLSTLPKQPTMFAVRQRHSYTKQETTNTAASHSFTPLDNQNGASFEPLVIPVVNFAESPSSSKKSSPREERISHSMSQKSNEGQRSLSSEGQTSPRSEDESTPRQNEFEVQDRFATVHSDSDSDISFENIGDFDAHDAKHLDDEGNIQL
ncbi:LHFPL tetraspan subfamily member 3 protein-like isoform X2 [Mya arenaria]|uniref:LHFPL tetraspan subfamily member 3 protein-like isoform X2 n=1 Tax=Mya arenaria TaxID=6604 RepID=UPI0022E8CC7F|nr:LHFPL tetraspan subfamily member 3 protein-like isoform X2 [Mya arenaria]